MKIKDNKKHKAKKWTIINPIALAFMLIRSIWFFGILIFVVHYNSVNWTKCINFREINGNNILFILLIVMLLYPLVSNMKFSFLGIGLEFSSSIESKEEIIRRAAKNVITEINIKKSNEEDANLLVEKLKEEIREVR